MRSWPEPAWQMLGTEPGACAGPDALPAGGWLPARVPGTVAGALAAAGAGGGELDDRDWWFRTTVRLDPVAPGERRVLVLDGLATIAEVFVAGALVLASRSMFLAHELELAAGLSGEVELAICLRALTPPAGRRTPRARWRTRIAAGDLRFLRTMLLGRMPGIAPGPPLVGPYRDVRIEHRAQPELAHLHVRTRLDGDDGIVEVRARLRGSGTVTVTVGDAQATLDADGRATLRLAAPALWWPHTHGDPALHRLRLAVAGADGVERVLCERRIGFREATFLDDPDGVPQLVVGGVPVFVRGAVWTPCPRAELRATLELARDAGLNLIRIPGIAMYEEGRFHDLCDELGIVVWQDAMFANFDYPIADPGFRALVTAELEQLLDAVGWRPSLMVVCGGSEVEQQAAMMGRDPLAGRGELFGDLLPSLIEAAGVDVSYVPSAPSGGTLPFRFDRGVANYFGVGGYRRPLGDVRAAGVRFASECLAVANVPDDDESWKAGVQRDAGAGWDFGDVRDHYLRELHDIDPVVLAERDPARYRALSREVSGELMAHVFGEWRRAASPCSGGIVLWLRDLVPGAGWGLLDHRGEPKLALGHLRRVCAPLAVWLTDEGLAGIAVHVAHDGAEPLTATLRVALARGSGPPVAAAERVLELAPRSVTALDAEDLLGRFLDASWAYRFGPCAHAAVIATLVPADGRFVAPAAWFPPGSPPAADAAAVRAAYGPGGIEIESANLLRGARIEIAGARPAADGFVVEPDRPLIVPLERTAAAAGGRLTALNLAVPVAIGAR